MAMSILNVILQASFYTFDLHPLYIFFHNFQVLLIGEIY